MEAMPWTFCKELFSNYNFWVLVFLVIEIPLCLLRSLRSISFASLGSVIVMVLCCIVIIMYVSSLFFVLSSLVMEPSHGVLPGTTASCTVIV